MKILCICLIIILIIILYVLFYRQLYYSENVISGNKDIYFDKLMIVAHPDDELIFGGSELIKEKGWKVICVTNGSSNSVNIFGNKNINRTDEFISLMDHLQCAYEIWDFEDNGFNCNWSYSVLYNKIYEAINEKEYQKILTHNLDGEYGHIQHKFIGKVVYQMHPKNLYVFGKDHQYINPYALKVIELLSYYPSQKRIIHQHLPYIIYQKNVPVHFD